MGNISIRKYVVAFTFWVLVSGLLLLGFKYASQTSVKGETSLQNVILSDRRTTTSTEEVKLITDSDLDAFIYNAIESYAKQYEYVGGAGVIMDVETGTILSLVSYPEALENSTSSLNKVTNGLYMPGSVIKPFVAIAALSEGIIVPEKKILSTGSISLPNPFKEGDVTVFHDWKAHGYVDMREAIGVSSNVYFYTIGGGFQDQEGLGIERLEKYLRLFGFGSATGIDFLTESEGAIPSPEWKAKEFNGDAWRVGDTYLASIGQHGYAVTPLQLVRAIGAIANEGKLMTPTDNNTNASPDENIVLPIKKEHFKVVKEGMEYAVVNGTASGLYLDGISVAAKTGTAEVGIEKKFIHSWIAGYFPKDKPKYVFVFILEEGPRGEEVGAVALTREILLWVREHRPEYLISK